MAASPRVLLLVENLPVPFDRRVWQQALALRDAGYGVTVVCPALKGARRGREILEGIEVLRHPLPEANGALGYLLEYPVALACETWLAWRTFLGPGFALVQGCNPPDLLWLVAQPFRLLGRPYVFDQHDLGPELFEAKFGRRGPLHALLRLCERLSYRLSDHVLATNDSYRRFARERGGVPADRVTVVRNGPDLARFRAVDPDPSWKAGKRHLLVYVGIMGPQEGVEDLLAAMRLLVDARDDVRLVLAGDGPAVPALEARAAALGLGDTVHFAGRLGDDRLIPLLATADVCVAPDPRNPMNDASTMLKTMEYMAAGKPMVQVELTEGRVTAAEASLYARPGDPADFAAKVGELLDDPDRRVRMGRAGRERVEEELQWGCQAPRYLEVIRGLLSRGARARGPGAD